MQFVELPNIAGRNDTITRDFFAPAGWRNFSKGTGAENSADNKSTGEAVAGDGTKELAAKITGGLELQAVWMSHQPRASVNGKPVVTGDILQIRDGVNKYDCEVVKIEETKVHVRCGTVQVILKMQGVLK